MKTLMKLAAVLAAMSPLVPAMAQHSPDGNRSEVVSYADLDLSRTRDVRKLDRRLRSAIEQVCGPISSTDPAGRRAVHDCRTALRAEVEQRRAEILAGTSNGEPIRIALDQ